MLHKLIKFYNKYYNRGGNVQTLNSDGTNGIIGSNGEILEDGSGNTGSKKKGDSKDKKKKKNLNASNIP